VTAMDATSTHGVRANSHVLEESLRKSHGATLPVAMPVTFSALDGYELGGVLHTLSNSVAPSCTVVFNCGGGIPAIRYSGVASYLASNGIPVLTYDYRGVGMSCPEQLRGFAATVEDWSELDCSGAIAWMRNRFPRSEIVGMSHSVGAMLFGGTTNSFELSKLIFIGAHTGYFGDYGRFYRIPMAVLWHVFMPMLTHAFGYFPGRALHLGEDIPAGVALQWASRRTPELRSHLQGTESERTKNLLLRYKEIHAPTYALSFADDAFATLKGGQRLLSMYSGVAASQKILAPASVGLRNIGHFGFFRRSNGPTLWPLLLPFLRSEPNFDIPLPGQYAI